MISSARVKLRSAVSSTIVVKRNLGVRGRTWAGPAIGRILLCFLVGCSAIYADIPTPVRPAPSLPQEPGPPDDILSLAIREATIPNRTRDGRSWGKDKGDLPDPYVVILLDDKEILRSEARSDTLHPDWSDTKPQNHRIPPNSDVRVEIWDENTLVSHPICSQHVGHLHDSTDDGTYEGNCDSGARFVLLVEPAVAQIGLGFSYEPGGGGIRITDVVPASPAGRLGLSEGDTILSIDSRPLDGLDRAQLRNLVDTQARGGLRCKILRKSGKNENITIHEGPLYVPTAHQSAFK
jgi:hypothetical protein